MIQLYHGDCLEIMKTMPDNSVDAVVTDPPFKISQEYSQNADADNLIAVSSIWLASSELHRIAKPGTLAAVFYDIRILPLALKVFNNAGWKYLRALTFYRKWGNAHKLSGWMSTSDFILIFTKPGEKYKFNGPWRHDVYIKDKPEQSSFNHPAQKPIDCVNHLVENISPVGGVVIDPYMGSGTTGVACLNTGRAFIGVEQEREYFEIAKTRIEQHRKGLAV